METSTPATTGSEPGQSASRGGEAGGKSFRSCNLNAVDPASRRAGLASRYPQRRYLVSMYLDERPPQGGKQGGTAGLRPPLIRAGFYFN